MKILNPYWLIAFKIYLQKRRFFSLQNTSFKEEKGALPDGYLSETIFNEKEIPQTHLSQNRLGKKGDSETQRYRYPAHRSFNKDLNQSLLSKHFAGVLNGFQVLSTTDICNEHPVVRLF